MVDPETVTLGIRIDEETSLEKGIRRRLDVRDQVGRREGQLVCRQYHDANQENKPQTCSISSK